MSLPVPRTVKVMITKALNFLIYLDELSFSLVIDGNGGKVKMGCCGVVHDLAVSALQNCRISSSVF